MSVRVLVGCAAAALVLHVAIVLLMFIGKDEPAAPPPKAQSAITMISVADAGSDADPTGVEQQKEQRDPHLRAVDDGAGKPRPLTPPTPPTMPTMPTPTARHSRSEVAAGMVGATEAGIVFADGALEVRRKGNGVTVVVIDDDGGCRLVTDKGLSAPLPPDWFAARVAEGRMAQAVDASLLGFAPARKVLLLLSAGLAAEVARLQPSAGRGDVVIEAQRVTVRS